MDKIKTRNWNNESNKEIVVDEQPSHYDQLITKKKNEKKVIKKNKEENIKLSKEDEQFLLELEKKIEESEKYSGKFNLNSLFKYEMKENKNNILYEEYIKNINILKNIDVKCYEKNKNILFSKIKLFHFLKIKNEEKKISYLLKMKEKKIFQIVKKIKSLKRPLEIQKNTENNIIDIKSLNKIYESKTKNNFVLKDINLTIKKGEFIVLTGPSGSGKTTLMNIISGIDSLTYGEINVDGVNISILKESSLSNFRLEKIGYIFQNYGLLSNLNVYDNVAIGGYMRFLSKKNKDNKKYDNYLNQQSTNKILKLLFLYDIKEKMPYELSGGQKQRVSIGRTLAKRPTIIFADEPTSSLDEVNAKNIINLLKKINKNFKTTIIMITHDDKNIDYASKIIKLKNGKII